MVAADPPARSIRGLLDSILDTVRRIGAIAADPDEAALLPPASVDALQRLESRCGFPLPPTYREFLTISNGFQGIAGGFDLLGCEQMLRPEYDEEVRRIRTLAWDSGQRSPLEGFAVGLRPGSDALVLLDRSRPTRGGELTVVHWCYSTLGESSSFSDFLAYWDGVSREVLARIQSGATTGGPGPQTP